MTKSDEIITKLISLAKDMEYTKKRLDRINGCLGEFPVTKRQVEENTTDLKELKPVLSNLKIKFYGIASAIGILSGFAGVLIGKII
jgi:hypothetical protein